MVEIPANIKRGFARLAGLIELADDEFVRLKRDIKYHETQLGLLEDDSKNEITKNNLIYLFTNNIYISQTLTNIAERTGFSIDNKYINRNFDRVVANLLNSGFNSIIKIILFIENNNKNIEELATNTLIRYYNKKDVNVTISCTLVIRYMILFYILKLDNKEFTKWYFTNNAIDNKFIKILNEVFSEISET